jgi:hypothetical protein
MNLDDGVDGDAQQPTAPGPPKKRRVYVCPYPFCGLKGHMTTKSKKCKANPERLQRDGTVEECAAAVAAATSVDPVADGAAPIVVDATAPPIDADAINDVEDHDALPLQSDSDSSRELFADAGTWSEDEEGNLTRFKL